MNLALFGATGGTGQATVEQALEQGHTIQALVRTPANLSTKHKNLIVIEGNVLEPKAVQKTVAGSDAVICSLGTTKNNPDNVVSQGTWHIIEAMNQTAVRRLLVVTSLGVGDSKDQVPFAFKLLMKTMLKKVMADKDEQERLVQASGLDWTIIRPGGLTDDPRTGEYTIGTGTDIIAGRVSRADVANFLLKQLNDDTYLHQAVAIT